MDFSGFDLPIVQAQSKIVHDPLEDDFAAGRLQHMILYFHLKICTNGLLNVTDFVKTIRASKCSDLVTKLWTLSFSVYGQHDMFAPPKAPIDKVLVLTYSNIGKSFNNNNKLC